MLDPERAQIEKLEPTLFDIVLRPEEFISESSLEDESDYLEEIPAALIPLLSPQEPKEEQQPQRTCNSMEQCRLISKTAPNYPKASPTGERTHVPTAASRMAKGGKSLAGPMN